MAITKKPVKKTNVKRATVKKAGAKKRTCGCNKGGVCTCGEKCNCKNCNCHDQDSVKYTNMFAAYRAFWSRGFIEWRGTSSRSEYWWSWLANALICAFFVLSFTGSLFASSFVTTVIMAVAFLYLISAIIPAISMLTRRMHDAGLSAWFWLLYLTSFIPYIGSYIWTISILVIALLPTRTVDNPYHKFNK